MGTGYIGLPCTSDYLAHKLGLEGGRVFFTRDGRAVNWFLVGHGQGKLGLRTVNYLNCPSLEIERYYRLYLPWLGVYFYPANPTGRLSTSCTGT